MLLPAIAVTINSRQPNVNSAWLNATSRIEISGAFAPGNRILAVPDRKVASLAASSRRSSARSSIAAVLAVSREICDDCGCAAFGTAASSGPVNSGILGGLRRTVRIAALNGAVTRQDVELRYAASIRAMVSAEACAIEAARVAAATSAFVARVAAAASAFAASTAIARTAASPAAIRSSRARIAASRAASSVSRALSAEFSRQNFFEELTDMFFSARGKMVD